MVTRQSFGQRRGRLERVWSSQNGCDAEQAEVVQEVCAQYRLLDVGDD